MPGYIRSIQGSKAHRRLERFRSICDLLQMRCDAIFVQLSECASIWSRLPITAVTPQLADELPCDANWHCPYRCATATIRTHMNVEQIVAELRGERDRLDQAIAALEGSNQDGRRGRAGGRRRMSASARARISAAQKARWAKQKRTSGPHQKAAPKKHTGGMSAAARKQQSERMKARWVERKKQQGGA
jgi:hypothetical protein